MKGLAMIKAIKSVPSAVKAVFVLLISAAVLIPAAPAFASDIAFFNWWGSNFAFNTTLTSDVRYFDLSNIGCEFTSYTTDNPGREEVFDLALYRDEFPFDYNCGNQVMIRDGYNHPDWYNVGSGNYYFYFTKINDGEWVRCDRFEMFSW